MAISPKTSNLTIDEMRLIAAFLLREYIDYENVPLMKAVDRLFEIVKNNDMAK